MSFKSIQVVVFTFFILVALFTFFFLVAPSSSTKEKGIRINTGEEGNEYNYNYERTTILNKIEVMLPENWKINTVDENLTILLNQNRVEIKFLINSGIPSPSDMEIVQQYINGGARFSVLGNEIILPKFQQSNTAFNDIYPDLDIFNIYITQSEHIDLQGEFLLVLPINKNEYIDIVISIPSDTKNKSRDIILNILKSIQYLNN